jgi:hypothetical protein
MKRGAEERPLKHRRLFVLEALLVCGAAAAACSARGKEAADMSKRKDGKDGPPSGSVVNWDVPSKRDLVERAVSDGVADPAKIVEWARSYKVTLTVDEVVALKKDLGK